MKTFDDYLEMATYDVTIVMKRKIIALSRQLQQTDLEQVLKDLQDELSIKKTKEYDIGTIRKKIVSLLKKIDKSTMQELLACMQSKVQQNH